MLPYNDRYNRFKTEKYARTSKDIMQLNQNATDADGERPMRAPCCCENALLLTRRHVAR